MTELTLEVRAERATRKRNKKIAALYPLLADQLAVTVESQIARLEKQEIANAAFFERFNQHELDAWQQSLEYKEIARNAFPAELFNDYETRYQRIYGSRGKWAEPEHVGHFAADWWWCALRDSNTAWCWDNCPNELFHKEMSYRKVGMCPTCRSPLTPPAPEPAGLVQSNLL